VEILSRKHHEELFSGTGLSLPTESTVDEMRETLRTQGKQSLYFFATAILNWSKIRKNPHFALCNYIQDVSKGRRKVLLVPRDTYKSTIGSKSLPLWILIQDEFCGLPGREHRILLCSHSGDNAKKQIKSIRQQVERNQILHWLYPELIPDFGRTTWTDSNLLFPREGSYGEDTIESAGIDTHLVSRHYTVQIKDDLEDKASYESPTIRKRVKDFYRSAESLFVDEQQAYDLLIGTRWGHDDVYADIQKNESDTYQFLVRPLHWTRAELEADLEEAKRSGDPPVWNMDPDEFAPEYGKTYYFFEELFPAASCKRIRQKQGTFMYSMLYLNNPKNPELAEFNENDLRWFVFDDEGNLVLEHADGTHEVVPFAGLRRVCFWDPAMSEAEQKKNARNAMIVMFKDQKGRLFIPEAYAERKNPTLLFSKFISFHQRYELHQAAIEDVGFQRTLKFPLFYAMREVNYTFSVTEQAPIASKHARIRTLAPYVEAHMVYLRKGAPGIKDLVDELKSFPIAGTVDLLDAAAACLPLFGLVKAEEGRNMYRIRRAVGDEERRLATRSGITGY
jgi:predicted phage terminase large subunit-like protein